MLVHIWERSGLAYKETHRYLVTQTFFSEKLVHYDIVCPIKLKYPIWKLNEFIQIYTNIYKSPENFLEW